MIPRTSACDLSLRNIPRRLSQETKSGPFFISTPGQQIAEWSCWTRSWRTGQEQSWMSVQGKLLMSWLGGSQTNFSEVYCSFMCRRHHVTRKHVRFLSQWFPECGPSTGSNWISWELVWNADSLSSASGWLSLKLWGGTQKSVLGSPPGDGDAGENR